MSKTAYQRTLLTGGSTEALDGIDGAGLLDGDFAFVMTAGTLYAYALDADSAAAESSPTVISPDNNAGDKRWLLKNAYSAANVPSGGTAGQALVKVSGTDYDMLWSTLSALTSLYPSASPSADHTVSGIIATMQVGEIVVFGDQLYMKSDGKLWKADKDSADTMPIVAMAAATILANDSGQVLKFGFARDDTWNWTLGGSAGLIYASTAGGLTQTRPTSGSVQLVAIATHADRLFFFPQAMEPVDAPATTAANDFQVGDGSGAWVKKTLAEVLAILMPSPGAIGETTPNTIRSLIKEIVKDATGSLTAAECSGTIVNNYGQSDDTTLTLPAAASGLSFLVVCGTTVAKYLRLDPDAGDKIILDGTAGSDGEYVGIASAAQGAAISFAAIQTGASSYDWLATTISGTWAAE